MKEITKKKVVEINETQLEIGDLVLTRNLFCDREPHYCVVVDVITFNDNVDYTMIPIDKPFLDNGQPHTICSTINFVDLTHPILHIPIYSWADLKFQNC
jgi:hypothetical protein